MSLSNTVETYDLQLKPSYKRLTPASGYALHIDTDAYPILKSQTKRTSTGTNS